MEYWKKLILAFIIGLMIGPQEIDAQIITNDPCPKDVQVLQKGATANCDGFLFSHTAESNAEADRNNAAYYKSLSDSLDQKTKVQADENQVLEQRLKLYMDSTQSLSTDLAKRDTNESLYRFIYFGIGVITTGLIVRNLRP